MSEEDYVATYKGHVVYYFRYREGGTFNIDGGPSYFNTLAEAYAAIDALTPPPPPPDVGDQGPTTSTRSPFMEHRGVTIYTDSDLPDLFFRVNGVEYSTQLGEYDARQIIDGLLGPPQEGEEGFVYVSPLEPGELTFPSGWGWLAGPFNWMYDRIKEIFKSDQDAREKVAVRSIAETRSVSLEEAATIRETTKEVYKPAGLGGWLWGGFVDTFKEITSGLTEPLQDAGKKAIDQALSSMGEHSMEPELKAKVDALLKQIKDIQEKAIKEVSHSVPDPASALIAAWELASLYTGSAVGLEVGAAATDLVHPIKQIQARAIVSKMLDRLHLDNITNELINMPTEKGLLRPIEKYYNALFTPEIPAYQDMIEMVVKEVITIGDFKATMKLLGYSEDWSQKIWDKHFIPPSLSDILTAWRRGIITEKRVDELMILVDLDPRFKNIFDTRKYVDPPLSMIRFMFETGNIDAATVKELIHLQGYRPEHEEMITNYLTEFQSRLWRRRYLVSLSQGFQKGVYSQERLEAAVAEAEYTPDVAKYIVANALVRREVAESGVTAEKPKLLSVGELKKAYIENMISRDALATELAVRGYPLDQADLLLKLLDQEKVVESAGGSKVALSQAELVDAWKYEEISEDQFRTELQLRGLSLAEVEILIRTKKKKWGVGGQEVG